MSYGKTEEYGWNPENITPSSIFWFLLGNTLRWETISVNKSQQKFQDFESDNVSPKSILAFA